ncbi:GAF domain-like protein [Schizophyllum amplum]|uniref:GAF domain-like protein n=1 Tax=Schizophyllum amplum TaxID=97359 RepID=A0A550CZL7_9AGAR|nr:GAF domain-like protein [Auriculariopsis ampla]
MPHADSSLVPESIKTKTEFWNHVYDQLNSLLDGQRSWVTNLANASSLIYNSLAAFPAFGTDPTRAVNWCGFYLDALFFPSPRFSTHAVSDPQTDVLLLGPFCGKPACQFINVTPGKARGVCANAFIRRESVLVPDVDEYPGHIACDGDTKSEVVCPLILRRPEGDIALGVLDLDCLAVGGFDADDKAGLEEIAHLLVAACDW